MKHYHTGENVPGYLPEADVFTTTRLEDARGYARVIASEYRDVGGYAVFGNSRDGYRVERRPASPYDLGVVIWVTECWEEDCTWEEGS